MWIPPDHSFILESFSTSSLHPSIYLQNPVSPSVTVYSISFRFPIWIDSAILFRYFFFFKFCGLLGIFISKSKHSQGTSHCMSNICTSHIAMILHQAQGWGMCVWHHCHCQSPATHTFFHSLYSICCIPLKTISESYHCTVFVVSTFKVGASCPFPQVPASAIGS